MKIIHFCESLSVGGGIASFIQNISDIQCKTNNVSIAVIGAIEDNRVNINNIVKIIDFNKKRPGFSIKYPLLIFLFLLRNRFDVVHIHSSFLYYILPILFLHRKMRFVYTVHSDAVKENSTWDKRFFRLKRFCFRQRWILPITISPSSKISFDKLYGMESLMVINGIKKNPNVVQSNVFNRYRHTNNTTILFHPARITEAKNQVMLCESVQQLINEGWDIVLIIAGVCQDEMIFDQLKKYFSDRIVYLGERRDVINLLCESDVMCLSSIWEGLPISLLEAMSVGSVPICTPVGGIPDVISSGYNGFVSKSVSVQDYKDAILEYINLDTKSKQQLKMNVIKSFQDYDIINVNDKYLNIYRS